ncbi:unnamed protein product [Effrenium voratum]|uniref:TLC domain-containing protein n=1 Tax=Effrenium voratum TaxID=2562239 RepID=A0AA36NKN4_9DINO|nr:unnamed protein product [Effrenium voratum]
MILASFMVYESAASSLICPMRIRQPRLLLYAAYGKGLAFWVHHLMALVICLNWLVLRTGTFWGCAVLLTEATTPCLVATRMMKETGWTQEPFYKFCVACFWLFWAAARICWLVVLLSLFYRDISHGLPEHVPLYFVAVNGLSVLGLLVLSCVWFVPITRIFYQVMTGKSRRQ